MFDFKNREQQYNKNSMGERLDCLTPEGELPFGWFTRNKTITDKIKQEYRLYLSGWLENRNMQPEEQYAPLKSFVMYMNEIKKLCAFKGECFDYWRKTQFDDDFLGKRTEELEYLEDELTAKRNEEVKPDPLKEGVPS